MLVGLGGGLGALGLSRARPPSWRPRRGAGTRPAPTVEYGSVRWVRDQFRLGAVADYPDPAVLAGPWVVLGQGSAVKVARHLLHMPGRLHRTFDVAHAAPLVGAWTGQVGAASSRTQAGRCWSSVSPLQIGREEDRRARFGGDLGDDLRGDGDLVDGALHRLDGEGEGAFLLGRLDCADEALEFD